MDQHLGIQVIEGILDLRVIFVVFTLAAVVDLGTNHTKQLLASPQRTRLDDRGRGHEAVPGGDPHHRAQKVRFFDEHVAQGHEAHTQQGVLYDTHHVAIVLRGNNVTRHHHQIVRVGARGDALRHVQVHLVSVEIGVIRRGHGQVETESGPVENLGAMAHDGHLVQRGLTVEQHNVVIPQVALDGPAVLQHDVVLGPHIAQIDAALVATNDIHRTRPLQGAVGDQLAQLVDVKRRHGDRHGEDERHTTRHTDLVDTQVGVGCDDRTGREVHTLAHEVASDASLLAAQALAKGLQRTTCLLGLAGVIVTLIVEERGNARLQQCLQIRNHHARMAFDNGILQHQVRLDNVRQLESQIILRLNVAFHHRGAHVRGRHGQHSDKHPLRPGPFGVEADLHDVFIADASEDFEHLLCAEHLLALPRTGNRLHVIRVRHIHRHALAAELGHRRTAGRLAVA
mmetsp:Transcript_8511/g.14301  ORF Transcript_8511/g.14301 Transcript_8511/m.14301 type:complete len:454 (-) Transcript_8511:782-2143(-)